MLFHEGFDLFFDGGRLGWFVAFNPHRGLHSLADFFIQAGSNLHLVCLQISNPPGMHRPSTPRGMAGIAAELYMALLMPTAHDQTCKFIPRQVLLTRSVVIGKAIRLRLLLFPMLKKRVADLFRSLIPSRRHAASGLLFCADDA